MSWPQIKIRRRNFRVIDRWEELADMWSNAKHGNWQEMELLAAIELKQAASENTPIVSGSLASAHTAWHDNIVGIVEISQHAVNPLSDQDPWQYGPWVHSLGGISASGHHRNFYEHTVITQSAFIATLIGTEIRAIVRRGPH